MFEYNRSAIKASPLCIKEWDFYEISNERYMKIILPVVSLLLVLSLLFSTVVFASQDDDKLNYVVIGDSIARGAGVLNPDEACYGLMVANTNGYDYVNHGIDGYLNMQK